MPRARDFLRCLFLALIVTGGAAANAQSPEDVLSAVRSRLAAATAISADFEQTFSSEFIDQTETTSGKVLLQGDRYRVETSSQVYVTDGEIAWVYNRPENQVLINNFSTDETTFSLNRFMFDSENEYDQAEVEAMPGDREIRLRLVSREPGAFFPEVTMFVAARDYMIQRLEVLDANGTNISIRLSNVTVNPVVPRNSFTFQPPETSEVVDLRS